MSLKRTGLGTAPIIAMIVHSESGLWQERKAINSELGGNRKGRIGAKRLEWQAGGERRGRRLGSDEEHAVSSRGVGRRAGAHGQTTLSGTVAAAVPGTNPA